MARIDRSGEDVLMLYTGGTTGNPKGVTWRHADLFGALAVAQYGTAGVEAAGARGAAEKARVAKAKVT